LRKTDPSNARAIEQSLALAADADGDLTAPVYALLFRQHPEMEALFIRDTNGLIKGEMLMRAFEVIMDFVGERRYAHHFIASEVITHEGYEVPRTVFASFFTIVREVVKTACAEGWTEEMELAWQQMLAEFGILLQKNP